MVGQHMFEWTQKQLKEARREGRKEGLREGRRAARQQAEVEGMRWLFLEMLELRFGNLSLPVRQRVESIQSDAELLALAGKILTADSLAEMGLAEEPAKGD